MKLNINTIYKLLEPGDIEEAREYSYWVCIGFRDNAYILHSFEQWAYHNGLGDQLDSIEDFDEEFNDNEELDLKHFKKFNSLEALYYVDKTIDYSKPKSLRKKFSIV